MTYGFKMANNVTDLRVTGMKTSSDEGSVSISNLKHKNETLNNLNDTIRVHRSTR